MTEAARGGQPIARIASLDIVRGIIMLLMAVDHVRVYAGVPAGSSTSASVFLTRWITHFCAPGFVFLAGTSAYLLARKLGGTAQISRFLVTRGAFLVFLELTVFRFSWTFNFAYAEYSLAGVIWMLGCCMVLLGALVWLPWQALLTIGAVIVAGHNALGGLAPEILQASQDGSLHWLWQVVYFGGQVVIGGLPIIVLYSLVPWIGVMTLGYLFGRIVIMPPTQRRRWCFGLGLVATLMFVGLRLANGYGDPRPWNAERGPAWISFLATTKYPASLLFLLMTLGPTLLALGWLDAARGRVVQVLSVYGRVPMFYYLLHIALIHLVFVALSVVRFGEIIPWMTANHPMNPGAPPDGYAYSLPALYAIAAVVVIVLYLPCRWCARLRAERRQWWMGYI